MIAASAATVALTFLGMIFTKLGVFSTCGPALAVAVGVAFLAAVTLLPAIIVLAGRRGWINHDATSPLASGAGRESASCASPDANLVASVMVLLVLAGCVGLARLQLRRPQNPAGFRRELHRLRRDGSAFPDLSSMIPQYLLIQSPHDLRTPQALADMEQMAQRISQLPGVAKVRGITRPTGKPIEAGQGDAIRRAKSARDWTTHPNLITDHSGDLDKLANGLRHRWPTASAKCAAKSVRPVNSVRGLVDALRLHAEPVRREQDARPDRQRGQARRPACKRSATRCGANLDNVGRQASRLGRPGGDGRSTAARTATTDSSLRQRARPGAAQLDTARNDGTLDKIADLARQLQSTQGAQTLESTLTGLRRRPRDGRRAMRSSGAGQTRRRSGPAGHAAAGRRHPRRREPPGWPMACNCWSTRPNRWARASVRRPEFLLAMKKDASAPSMAGFYIPPQLSDSGRLQEGRQRFVSPDGHAVRYLVQTEFNPFSTDAMDQVNAIIDTARGAQPNTALADASISMTGYPVRSGTRGTTTTTTSDSSSS